MEQSRKKEVRVVFTGGHAATTAAAVIEEINLSQKRWRLYWIGVRNAIEGRKMLTLESEVIPKLGVKFLPLITGRIQRRFTFWTIPSLFKIPLGFIQSFYYLVKIKPRVVLSFGGFASFPVVFNAWVLRIPVIIHEQTAAVGRANQLSARFASQIALARKESVKYFPSQKCVVTGNPVMKDIARVKFKSRIGTPPTIFITGGSRGSQAVNSRVEGILRTLLGRYRIIHQTGTLDIRKFSDIKQRLPKALKENYLLFIRINPYTMPKIYEKSDIVVSRAGANTVSEIMTVKRPAILIPLAISFLDEQTKNANIARDWGIARVIPQEKLTSQLLLKEIDGLAASFYQIISRVKVKKSLDVGASGKVLSILNEYVR